eukprot:Pompholyxophrys_sp_v1_NODE_5_length_12280_cov_3.373988.p11 type:complete len:143 gc:universal NODE_5_length_12280_cov_3.373988:5646-6074(+)
MDSMYDTAYVYDNTMIPGEARGGVGFESGIPGEAEDVISRIQEGIPKSEISEDFSQSGGSLWSNFKSVFYFLFAVVGILLFGFAMHSLFQCDTLGEWTRVIITFAFVILPILGPLAFIMFNNYKPICKGAAKFLAPIVKVAT